jgi:hypothetical protein
MDRSSTLVQSTRHPLVDRLATLLERGDSLQLRIAALEKATALVVSGNSSRHANGKGGSTTTSSSSSGGGLVRRHKDEIALNLLSGAVMYHEALLSSSSASPSRSAVIARHAPKTSTLAQRSAVVADAPAEEMVEAVSSASASSSATSSESSRSSSPASRTEQHGSEGAASHVTFLLNQVKEALSPNPHLAPPMPSALEYRRDVKTWLFGENDSASQSEHESGQHSSPHQPVGATTMSDPVSSAVPAFPSGPSLGAPSPPPPPPPPSKKVPPPPPPPPPLSGVLPVPAGTSTAPTSAVPVPPPLAPPPPKAAPLPPPSAAPAPAAVPPRAAPPPVKAAPPPPGPTKPIDWEEAAKAAIEEGTWRPVVDKQNRTYYFHVREKKTCWNLAKELERRAAAPPALES